MLLEGTLLEGAALDVGEGAPKVPDGLLLNAMYPKSPLPPHLSLGYPGQLFWQFPTDCWLNGM